jgi:hypothetical protein
MDNQLFIEKCKELVREYTMDNLDKSAEIPEFKVYEVWSCKTLQNNKGLFATSLPDKMYFECTYNGDKKELYFDAYVKLEKKCIKMED